MDRPTSFTRFQRMLLGTDGTVTHMLEAYSDESIEVVKLLQARDTAGRLDSALDLAPGEDVLRRRVLLQGARSHRILLYAEAVVALGRVQATFLDGLITTDKPIGILLAEARTETFREILHVGREPAGERGGHFDLDAGSELISRTYRIVRAARPMILITEKFPADFFRHVPA